MHIYSKHFNKHTGKTFPKKLVLILKNKIKKKSECALCLTKTTFIDKIEDKYGPRDEPEIYWQFSADSCYQRCSLMFLLIV